VSADYTGASADTVQKSVIVPIEEAINGVDGIDYISSNSTSSGSAYISVVFKSGIDPDMAVVMVKNRVAEGRPSSSWYSSCCSSSKAAVPR